MAQQILIVDDEPDICEILRFNLEMEGYDVFTAEGTAEAQDIVDNNMADHRSIDLILLDVMMTPKSGFEWAKELKANHRTAGIPIIFCTAKTLEEDLLLGFALGSDDYICKPFRISEVRARVKAVLRRTVPSQSNIPASLNSRSHQPEQTPLKISLPTGEGQGEVPQNLPPSGGGSGRGSSQEGLYLDMERKECFVDGKEVPFTKLEFELLALLLSKPGQVFSREKILQSVWPSDTIVLDRTVDVNITRIRKKIGRYGECLRTKFGYGYMFSN